VSLVMLVSLVLLAEQSLLLLGEHSLLLLGEQSLLLLLLLLLKSSLRELLLLLLLKLNLLKCLRRSADARRTPSASAVATADDLSNVIGSCARVAVIIDIATRPTSFSVHGDISLCSRAQLKKFVRFHLKSVVETLSTGNLKLWLVTGRHATELFRQRQLLVIFNV
jgi:hypothetical protein